MYIICLRLARRLNQPKQKIASARQHPPKERFYSCSEPSSMSAVPPPSYFDSISHDYYPQQIWREHGTRPVGISIHREHTSLTPKKEQKSLVPECLTASKFKLSIFVSIDNTGSCLINQHLLYQLLCNTEFREPLLSGGGGGGLYSSVLHLIFQHNT
jgi:hypothetical protein